MRWQLKAGLVFGITTLAVLFFILNPAEYELFPRCLFYSATGLYCPGCGSQRAIHSLLHLNPKGVVNNNILFIPAFIAVGYHYIHPLLNDRLNLNLPDFFYKKNTPWIVLIIFLLFWLLRNLPFLPFSALAPV
jgi:hypothetical protein